MQLSVDSRNDKVFLDAEVPLVVDLDGTLVKTDLLWETALILLRRQPWKFFWFFLWILRGKAFLKAAIAAETELDASHLPYDQVLVQQLREAHASGRTLILATGSHQKLALAVSHHLQLFHDVIASDGTINTVADHKRDILVQRYGERQFDYVGNSSADLAIWRSARRAYSVTTRAFKLDRRHSTERVGGDRMGLLQALLKAMRPRQWLKNLLVFVPILAAHLLLSDTVVKGLIAFVCFSCAASSAYLLNDTLDVHDDRVHLEKRKRPLAAGHLPLPLGLMMAPLLAGAAVALALSLSLKFLAVVLVYLCATLVYSLYLKRLMMVDVVTLAILYTLRIVGGGVATGIELSFWLLSFSFFIFLSLALLKRHSELYNLAKAGKDKTRGRAYRVEDKLVVSMLGVNSGFVALIIFMLYFNSENVLRLYKQPVYLIGIVPIIMLWLGRLWILSSRGLVNEDPILFVSRDKRGLVLIFAALMLAVMGSVA